MWRLSDKNRKGTTGPRPSVPYILHGGQGECGEKCTVGRVRSSRAGRVESYARMSVQDRESEESVVEIQSELIDGRSRAG